MYTSVERCAEWQLCFILSLILSYKHIGGLFEVLPIVGGKNPRRIDGLTDINTDRRAHKQTNGRSVERMDERSADGLTGAAADHAATFKTCKCDTVTSTHICY